VLLEASTKVSSPATRPFTQQQSTTESVVSGHKFVASMTDWTTPQSTNFTGKLFVLASYAVSGAFQSINQSINQSLLIREQPIKAK